MKEGRGGKLVRNLILLTLLAVLCIGFMELFFCRIADPPLYDTITAPVRVCAQSLYQDARRICLNISHGAQSACRVISAHAQAIYQNTQSQVESLSQRFAGLRDPSEESQTVDEPALPEENVPAAPAITEFVIRQGREFLTGGMELRYYNQSDDMWAEQLFGRDPIHAYGCGPTAISMLVSSMTGEETTPADVASWAAGAGYAAPGSGSYLSIVQGAAEHYGLICASPVSSDVDSLSRQLSSGAVIVALMGPGHFTDGGHFILLHGVTPTGEFLIADPNSRENSLIAWDAQLILDELSSSRGNGAPLWLITQPAT